MNKIVNNNIDVFAGWVGLFLGYCILDLSDWADRIARQFVNI
jgi:hypothetical protein